MNSSVASNAAQHRESWQTHPILRRLQHANQTQSNPDGAAPIVSPRTGQERANQTEDNAEDAARFVSPMRARIETCPRDIIRVTRDGTTFENVPFRWSYLTIDARAERAPRRSTGEARRRAILNEIARNQDETCTSESLQLRLQEGGVAPGRIRPCTRKIPEDYSCPICLTDVTEEDRASLKVWRNCGHIFHETCLARWTQDEKAKCPVCRQV
jgi:hypothetical protein